MVDDNFSKFNLNKPICKTSGVIYMIICGCCDIKYVGQSSTPLNLRINKHRSLCIKGNKSNTDIQCKYEVDHFKLHPFNQAKIRIGYLISLMTTEVDLTWKTYI